MSGTSLHDLKQELRTFLAETFALGPEDELEDHTSLLRAGVIDSTGVLEVVAYLESRYGIEIADEEIVPENEEFFFRLPYALETAGLVRQGCLTAESAHRRRDSPQPQSLLDEVAAELELEAELRRELELG